MRRTHRPAAELNAVEPVSETPTDPSDYAAVSLTFGALLAGLAYAARDRPLERSELAPLGAATFALAKLVGKEKVETWVREPFVEEGPEGRTPRGEGMRYVVGELLTCTRCLGGWSALGLVALRTAAPGPGRTVTGVLAASAVNDFLQAGFTWLTARADAECAKRPDRAG